MSVFFDHRRVNLYLRVWLGWCARRTQGSILVWAERPYVQFAAARVTSTWFAVRVTNMQERERIPSLWWKEWTGAESSIAAQSCARVVLLCSDLIFFCPPSMRRPASPFIGQGKARVTQEEKEKNEREKKAFRVAGSFFSFMLVPPIL